MRANSKKLIVTCLSAFVLTSAAGATGCSLFKKTTKTASQVDAPETSGGDDKKEEAEEKKEEK